MAKEGKIFYGWWIVAATFVVLLVGLCSGFYTVSVFLEPLQITFGWTTTQISLGFTIAALLVGLLSPVVGVAVAKFGVKKVQLYGASTVGIALLLLGSLQQLWQYYALLIFMATGLASISIVPSQTLISYWFTKKRGIAMGIIMAGIGVGGMVMVFVASQAAAAFGWRGAYRVLGLMVLCIVLPVILIFIKEKPEDIGLVPDGVALSAAETEQKAAGFSFTIGQAFKTLPFYVLAILVICYSLILGGMTQHAIALLRSMNVAQANIFWSLALGVSVLGRLIFGAAADKLSQKGLMMIIWVFQITGLVSIIYLADMNVLVWGFVIFYGCALGAFPTIFPLIIGRKFGLDHFSKFVGAFGLIQILSIATGVIMLGRMFDTSGSYAGAVQVLMVLAVIGTITATMIGEPKRPKPVLDRA